MAHVITPDYRRQLIQKAVQSGCSKKELVQIIYCTTNKTFRSWMKRSFKPDEALHSTWRYKVLTPAEVEEIFNRIGKPRV
jgi:hypothetical protein